jgi:hypothetical protein
MHFGLDIEQTKHGMKEVVMADGLVPSAFQTGVSI